MKIKKKSYIVDETVHCGIVVSFAQNDSWFSCHVLAPRYAIKAREPRAYSQMKEHPSTQNVPDDMDRPGRHSTER